MAFPVTLNGRTYTLADFEGTNYVDGLPDAFEDFVTQAGDIYNSTSTSSVAIGTGSKTFTTADSGKPYQAGTPLRIADAAAPETNFMDAIVTSYSGTTLVVDVFGYAGSGTKTSWTINIGGAKTVDGTLAISQGGTGATSASGARTNIDVYSKAEADSKFLDVSGEASNVTMTGDVTIGDTSGDTLTVNATASFSGDLAVDTDTLFVDVSTDRVGVNIAPNRSFEINSGDTVAQRWSNTGANNYVEMGTSTGSIRFGTASGEFILLTGGAADYSGEDIALTVDASGNVGIGADPSSPNGFAKNLTISGSSCSIALDETDANTWEMIVSSGSFRIYDEADERLRVDASGNLLVGTNITYGNDGTTIGTGEIVSKKTSFRSLTLERISTNGEIAAFRKDGTTVGSIGSFSGVVTQIVLDPRTSGASITGGTNKISPGNQNGALDDHLDLGSSAHRFKDLYLSGGAYLGGTAAANHLDDYEEGDWDIEVLAGYGGTDVVVSNSSNFAKYQKVGRTVFLYWRVNTATTSSSTIHISNLPYTGTQNNFQTGCGVVHGKEQHSFFVLNGSTFRAYRFSGANAPATDADGVYRGMLIYESN